MTRFLFALGFGALLVAGSPPAEAKRGRDMDLGMKVKVQVGDSTLMLCRCPTNYGNCFCTPKGMIDERDVGR